MMSDSILLIFFLIYCSFDYCIHLYFFLRLLLFLLEVVLKLNNIKLQQKDIMRSIAFVLYHRSTVPYIFLLKNKKQKIGKIFRYILWFFLKYCITVCTRLQWRVIVELDGSFLAFSLVFNVIVMRDGDLMINCVITIRLY